MDLSTGFETLLDGWWDGVDPEVIEPEIGSFTGGFWIWGDFTPLTPEERLDRIEAFLRAHKFIKINPDGDQTEVRYPW